MLAPGEFADERDRRISEKNLSILRPSRHFPRAQSRSGCTSGSIWRRSRSRARRRSRRCGSRRPAREGSHAVGTGVFERIDCGLVVAAVGYRSGPLAGRALRCRSRAVPEYRRPHGRRVSMPSAGRSVGRPASSPATVRTARCAPSRSSPTSAAAAKASASRDGRHSSAALGRAACALSPSRIGAEDRRRRGCRRAPSPRRGKFTSLGEMLSLLAEANGGARLSRPPPVTASGPKSRMTGRDQIEMNAPCLCRRHIPEPSLEAVDRRSPSDADRRPHTGRMELRRRSDLSKSGKRRFGPVGLLPVDGCQRAIPAATGERRAWTD